MADQPNYSNPDRPNEPYYPPTTHPEDAEDFGHGSHRGGASSYGSLPQYDGGYGYDYQPGEAGGSQSFLASTDGIVRLGPAMSFGFSATFRNWHCWIILGIIALAAVAGYLLYSISTAWDSDPTNSQVQVGIAPNSYNDPAQLVLVIIFALISPFLVRGALATASKKKVQWSDFFTGFSYWRTLGLQILSGVISNVVLFGIVFAVAGGFSSGSLAQDDITQALAIFGGMLLGAVIVFLIGPFLSFWAYFAADNKGGFGECIKKGVRLGAKNWGPLLGCTLVFSLCMGVALAFSFGLLVVIAAPVYQLAVAHVYRQMVGGPVPR